METWNRFRLPQGNFSVSLASLQANDSFSHFLSLTSLVQTDTPNTQAVSANVRLRYNYRPELSGAARSKGSGTESKDRPALDERED